MKNKEPTSNILKNISRSIIRTIITICVIFVILGVIIMLITYSGNYIKCFFSNNKVYTTAIVEKKYSRIEGIHPEDMHTVWGAEVKYVIDRDTIKGYCRLKKKEYKNINEQDTIPICVYKDGIMSKVFYKKCFCFKASFPPI